MSQPTNSFVNDLVCGFGFKKHEAELAAGMFISGSTTPAEDIAIRYLIEHEPFSINNDRSQPIVLLEGVTELMNNLRKRMNG